MEGFRRYAVYWAPEPGPLADFAAAWLGWDARAGTAVKHPVVIGLPRPVAELTATPRKYGFHGTLKPPFRLAEGADVVTLHAAAERLAASQSPVTMPGLSLHRLGGFLALTPKGDTGALAALAAQVVTALDGFRAPPPPEETARRRKAGLTPRQEENLARWGYPYVMEEFRFHLTLTGALPEAEAEATAAALAPILAPLLPRPFRVAELALFGEGADGHFHDLHRYPLSG